MKVYISGLHYNVLDKIEKFQSGDLEIPGYLCKKDVNVVPIKDVYLLETYFSLHGSKSNDKISKLCSFHDYLLDSGAFSFINGASSSKKISIDEYAEQYAYFVKEHGVKNFFELDVDSLVGYNKVKKIRHKIEQISGRQSIPVWHKSRGLEEFRKMCSDYSYVAIGGIVTSEIKRNEYQMFKPLIDIAHSCGCKVHGLGLTNLSCIKKYHFDSVDSSSWLTSRRYGSISQFREGRGFKQIHTSRRQKNIDAVYIHAFVEWMKYQQWAKRL